jgi:hypothetical protein
LIKEQETVLFINDDIIAPIIHSSMFNKLVQVLQRMIMSPCCLQDRIHQRRYVCVFGNRDRMQLNMVQMVSMVLHRLGPDKQSDCTATAHAVNQDNCIHQHKHACGIVFHQSRKCVNTPCMVSIDSIDPARMCGDCKAIVQLAIRCSSIQYRRVYAFVHHQIRMYDCKLYMVSIDSIDQSDRHCGCMANLHVVDRCNCIH